MATLAYILLLIAVAIAAATFLHSNRRSARRSNRNV